MSCAIKPLETTPDLPVLHRAAWLVGMNGPAVENGAVLVKGKIILAAGSYPSIASRCPAGVQHVDHGAAAIMPGLVNAHTHLELSALHGEIPLPAPSFRAWLDQILSRRTTLTPAILIRGILEGDAQLQISGTALAGDVTNGARLAPEAAGTKTPRHIFLEPLGFDRQSLESALGPDLFGALCEAAGRDLSIGAAAHSCYSNSPAVISSAKAWSRGRNRPFSIHLAEHTDEIEFLMTGKGFCRDILERLGRTDADWTPPGVSPIRYLERLGVLDSQTLLVHAVHMTASDWEIAAKRRCPVCFCPRSNWNLNVGRADVERAVQLGMTAALGTDSLASNADLNLFEEASFLLDCYPNLRPETVLAMLTMGGATALGQSHLYGSIEPGKRSFLLAVDTANSPGPTQLAEIIIRQGRKGGWQWANCPKTG